MEQKFINKEIAGIKESNIEKLKQLFPSVFKDGQLDFDELKNQIGQFEKADTEKYEFNWVGKQEAKQNAISEISGVTLKYCPEESKEADTTENIYIEGENLKVLKLLRNNYANKIKMIYIDPPYNTGNDTFVYPDSFKKTNKESKEELGITKNGENVVNILKDNMYKNLKESSQYHSAWLSMMYPRLKIAQELLTDDGIIFISIDDNEQDNLRKLCSEIFGEDNFIACLPTVMNLKGNNDEYGFAGTHEYTLVYSKMPKTPIFNNMKIKNKEIIEKEWKKDEYGYYKLGTLKGGGENGARELRPNLYFPIYVSEDCDFSLELNEKCNIELLPISNGMEMTWRWSKEKILNERHNIVVENKNGNFTISRKIRPQDSVPSIKPKTLFYKESYSSGNGIKVIKELFENKRIFNYTKPIDLLCDFIEIATKPQENAIILDFFSGSGSTAHSIMKINSESTGNRKYIMVQLPELCEEKSEAYRAGYKNICEIGKERIRRAGAKIKEETNANIDYGFKVFKLDETNINWEKEEYKRNIDKYILNNGFIDDKQKEELMKDFVDEAKDIDIVYEILLRYYGMPLSAKIEKVQNLGERTYSIGGVIIVCLEDLITEELIDKLSNIDFAKLYLRDSSFKGENSLELKQNLMTRLNLQKDYKNEKTYKVEFI